MNASIHLLLAICLAPAFALGLLAIPNLSPSLRRGLALLGAALNFGLVAATFGQESTVDLPWFGSAFDLSLRVYHTSSVVTSAAGFFGLLVTLFSLEAMKGHRGERLHYALMLLTLGLVNGAVFANSLFVLLFFWEALLATTYGMIAIGSENAYRTATKAFIIQGIGDLCFMMGIALVWMQTKTLILTSIHLPLEGVGAVTFVLLMTGALAKCGALPFHSWIPDAAVDAPTPFMAFLPASIEKLLGIYFLSRLTLDLFQLTPESWVSPMLMTLGSVTLLVAIMMALVQDDYRRLLAFSAVSQVGFILLGIGSGTTIGAVGALFHMVNHATYKSCLFLTAGAVEQQGHSTKLSELSGLRKKMPVTFACFLIAAASGAGVPLFAGFFSKELIFDAALETGTAFYLVAVLGSFLTTLAFLKLGHAAFFGKSGAGATGTNEPAKDAPASMLIPMVIGASVCVLFGILSHLPVERLILPMLPAAQLDALKASGHDLGGWPENSTLVAMTVVVLAGAALSHWFGVSLNGGPSKSVDHIRQSPGLCWVFEKAERRWFDPYDLFMKGVNGFARLTFRVDRATDWLFVAAGRLNVFASQGVRSAHRGNTSTYIVWSLVAATLVILYLGL